MKTRNAFIVAASIACALPAGVNAKSPVANATDIKRDVSIRFAKPAYRFTLAQAAKGISIEYDVVVRRDVPDIIPFPQDAGGCSQPDGSGLIVFETLSGNDQRYGLFDVGLCPPLEHKPATIRKGSYRHTFTWDGRNWGGGSDTSRPKGKPFPPGTYTLDASLTGQTVTKGKRELFHIAKQVKVTLVE